jgi:hypothetical protein
LSHLFEVFVIAVVLALSLRRAVFLLASTLALRILPQRETLPRVAVLVPAWNESAFAERLLQAFARLSYPMDKCSFVLVCDGCTDTTPTLFRSWAAQRSNALVIELPGHAGKSAALNAGLRMAKADIVIVLDADLRPEPDFVNALVRPFADGKVGATAAFLRPANADDNVVALRQHHIAGASTRHVRRFRSAGAQPADAGRKRLPQDCAGTDRGLSLSPPGRRRCRQHGTDTPGLAHALRGGRGCRQHRRRGPGGLLAAAPALGARDLARFRRRPAAVYGFPAAAH